MDVLLMCYRCVIDVLWMCYLIAVYIDVCYRCVIDVL